MKEHDRNEELDRFWDIESLVPKKKMYISKPVDTSVTEIEIPARDGEEAPATHPIPPPQNGTRRFIPPHTEAEMTPPTPLDEYTPEHALLRRVRIYRPKSTYQYYEAFLRDAVRLYAIHGEACERVTFFSYVPQYSQMNRSQLEWYLWWRDCVRRGEYLPTDYSYVLLYVYELINLSERLEADHILSMLIAVWENYRDIYRQLDGYLSEWICDFCILHRIHPNLPPRLLSAAMTHASLKEFYFSSDSQNGYAGALIAFCNNYDYRKSKFCAGENKQLFETWIPAVLSSVVDLLSSDGKLFFGTRMDDSRVMRSAYTGALCVCRLKLNIEVEYCSFSRSNELRYFITDVIKYTENHLRSYLGIRSRLTVYALPLRIKEHIDKLLDKGLPPRAVIPKIKREEPRAEYEKLYDAPQKGLSLSHAAEIEEASWSTTERLIEAFAEEESAEPENAAPESFDSMMEQPTMPTAEGDDSELTKQLQPYSDFLGAVLACDFTLQRQIAQKAGTLPDALANEINDIAVECTGDILIEDAGAGYEPIPDYKDLLTSLMQSFEA